MVWKTLGIVSGLALFAVGSMVNLLAATDWNPLIAAGAAAIGVAVPGGLALIAGWMQIQSMKAEQLLLKTQMDAQKAHIEKVEATANGLTKELMHATEKGALVRGAAEQKSRTDVEKALINKAVADERLRAEAEAKTLMLEKALADAAAKPNLIVGEKGNVVVDDANLTPVVVAGKAKTPIITDEKKEG